MKGSSRTSLPQGGRRDSSFGSGPLEIEMKLPLSRLCPVLLTTVIGIVVGGCNVTRVTLNTPLTPDDVAFIIPGQTTLSDVVTRLGTPDSITDTRTGAIATYRFLDLKY